MICVLKRARTCTALALRRGQLRCSSPGLALSFQLRSTAQSTAPNKNGERAEGGRLLYVTVP